MLNAGFPLPLRTRSVLERSTSGDPGFSVIEDEKEFPFCLLALDADGGKGGVAVGTADGWLLEI